MTNANLKRNNWLTVAAEAERRQQPLEASLAISMAEWWGTHGGATDACPDDEAIAAVIGLKSRQSVDHGVEALIQTLSGCANPFERVLFFMRQAQALGRSRMAWNIRAFRAPLGVEDTRQLALLGLQDKATTVRRNAIYTCHELADAELCPVLERIAGHDRDEQFRDLAREANELIQRGFHAEHEDGSVRFVISVQETGWQRTTRWLPSALVSEVGTTRVAQELKAEAASGVPPAQPPSWERYDESTGVLTIVIPQDLPAGGTVIQQR